MSSSSSNKQPLMVDRPANTSTLLTVASGQSFSTSLIPTSVGNATKVFDADAALTDTSISGAYIDEIWFQYSRKETQIISPKSAVTSTWANTGTVCVITPTGGNNARVGQEVFVDFTSTGGTLPADGIYSVTAATATTFTITIAAQGNTNGNCTAQLPTDFCFYLVSASTVTNINQFFPLFTLSIDSVVSKEYFSLTEQGILPYINHPVAQSGANINSANSLTIPKHRGLMLRRGQALFVATSGSTALTNGFYCNIQGGFY